MTEFLINNGLYGLAVGIITFLIIGCFHPIVIKGEYYWGVNFWIPMLFIGIIFAALSIIVDSIFWSIVFGVVSFSSFWGILEVFAQKKRVERGWFPMNPKRRHHYRHSPDNRTEQNNGQ